MGHNPNRGTRTSAGAVPAHRLLQSLLLLTCLLQPPATLPFENFSAVPGGIAGVLVGDIAAPAPRAFFGKSELPVIEHQQGWIALVGLSRDLAPGFYVVNSVDDEDHYLSHAFAVRPAARPIYRVAIPGGTTAAALVRSHPSTNEPPPVQFEDPFELPPEMNFILPADLPITYQFGLLDIGGSGHTLPFTGLGFAASRQAAVVSPAFGQVMSVDRPDGGGRVVIHHGGGLLSVFRNLSTVSVARDDWVRQGALVGNLPARDGVMLLPDWSVYLNDAGIDPLLMVSQKIQLE